MSCPGAIPAGESSDLLRRALTDAGAVVFITGPLAAGLPIVWVNSAFTRETGLDLADVAGRSPKMLASQHSHPADIARVEAAVAAGVPTHLTLRCGTRSSAPQWRQLSISPLVDDAAVPTHWVWTQVDVTEPMKHLGAQLASLTAERDERATLDLLAQASDLLMDLDQPDALGEIAALLVGAVVGWAGFYLNDEGLHYAEGMNLAAPPSGRGAHHARFRPGGANSPRATRLPREVFPVGDLPDLGARPQRARSESGAVADGGAEPPPATAPDRVQALLDGHVEGPIELDLAGDHSRWSASGWIKKDLAFRLRRLTNLPRVVTIHAIPGRQRVLGLLVVAPRRQGAASGAATATVLQLIARRAGTAIDNLRLYAREHRLAETLQRSMLPEQADIADLDVWTYYAPNSDQAQVGGDWYDVLEISPNVVGLVVGDVVGHDIEAAATMGQMRSMVRAYAYEFTVPGPVLNRVDRLVTGMRIPRSASVVYAALTRPPPTPDTASGVTPDGLTASGLTRDGVARDGLTPDGLTPDGLAPDGWTMHYTRAGHLPPLLIRASEVRQLDAAGGALVGFGARDRQTGSAGLLPGDILVFYTDGLIERRDRALRDGLTELIAVCAAITAIDAAGIGEELLSRFGQAPEDDVALVVVRIPDPVADAGARVASPRTRRWVYPSEPASIARARHAVVRTCGAWGMAQSANAELVVSELVANGVLHGWGHLELRLFDTDEGLRIEVADSNPAPPVTTEGHAHRVGGFGMQIVERLAEWGWEPSGAGKYVWARLQPGSGIRPSVPDGAA